MAAEQPFEPAVKSGAAGQTVSVTVSTTASTFLAQINSTNGFNPTLLATVDGQTTGVVYIRMSVESSTTIAASNTDTPMVLGPNPTIRLFANPAPAGITNIAVMCTVAPSVQGTNVWFTPGQGGVF